MKRIDGIYTCPHNVIQLRQPSGWEEYVVCCMYCSSPIRPSQMTVEIYLKVAGELIGSGQHAYLDRDKNLFLVHNDIS